MSREDLKGGNRNSLQQVFIDLAIIASILHQHHAGISVESEAGKGTQFKISFPAAS